MKYFIYITIWLICFSCAKKENSITASEEATQTVTDDVVQVEETANADFAEEAPMAIEEKNSLESDMVIQQQLQETLNLIVLQNKMDLSPALSAELKQTIEGKVGQFNLDDSIDALEVTHLKVESIESSNQTSRVKIIFDAEDEKAATLSGTGIAQITLSEVNIDGEIFTDYQIYFEEINMLN